MIACRFRLTLLSLLWLVGTGCHHDTLYMTVRSPSDLNAGRPMRMLVRAVDPRQYVDESYQNVADKVVFKDDTVLHSAVVYPNVPLTAVIKWPSSKGIAVYFFFTSPGSRWKTILEMPLPHSADIVLRQNNIGTVEQD
jgi:intracellular growth IglE-like protein